ncbi:hypothetical protein N3K66_000641 [Trichothecium roseum]|uniref:Uncharacterized protein n=1 Tax=Trichothecium roseum TaxID=47278 RepID=A0ACC0VCK4_9HYPO|nr:hypothetical protein N3K66_000641 [Trichothecium roseum]
MAPPAAKDMRRSELIIPYQEPKGKEGGGSEVGSALGSTLPMAAMILRNKMVGWSAVVISVQNWLGESEDSKKNAATPGWVNIGMSVMALATSYLPMFLPPTGGVKTAASS